jgi:micrococcal nuclease
MFDATVVRVVDGDTFEIDKLYKGIDIIRIADLDTPEKGEPGYIEATNKLARLILGKEVQLNPKAIDAYRRLVADVYISGRNVASLMA